MARQNSNNVTKRAMKFRLYPSPEQRILLLKTFGCARKAYNLMLDYATSHHVDGEKFVACTPALLKKQYPYLREIDSLALCNEQMHLNTAFTNCFKHKHTRFPKYKSRKHDRASYTTNCINGNIMVLDNAIKLPKVGYVKAVIHRTAPKSWKLKSVTVSMNKAGQFYASVLYELPVKQVVRKSVIDSKVLGVDYKSQGLYVDSLGNSPDMMRFFKKSHKRLSMLQRQLSHMIASHIVRFDQVNGYPVPVYDRDLSECRNIQKLKHRIAKLTVHIANQRLDALHKLSTEIANQYDYVCVEDMDMKAISNRGFGNGKVTMDNGYGIFRKLLDYKLNDRGGMLVKIDKWYPSSQLCHVCGCKNRTVKNLNIREWTCPHCSTFHDRDINAAINIKNEGLRLLKAM